MNSPVAFCVSTDFLKPGHDQYIYRHANGYDSLYLFICVHSFIHMLPSYVFVDFDYLEKFLWLDVKACA